MNRLRQYITPISASVLALFFVLTPTLAYAQSDASFIQQLVWTVLVAITGSILYISGIVFDFAINSFVIGFADYYVTSGVGFAVDRTWVTIRDFVNLFFIFGLIYIGFKMILDSNDSNTRRWLVNLIIAALLINFSLFITKFVVDFSNTMSTQIAISGFCDGGVCRTGTSATGQSGVQEVDITQKILDLMGITTLFNTSNDLRGAQANWGYIFGTAIMFLVAAFVLMAGGFILIIRFAMLNLFMVLSPFMFIGWILPPLSNMTSKYWDAFLRRAFFAPVYFLFLYFSFEIMKAFQTSLQQANGLQSTANVWSAADAATTIEATESTMPFFILICIFLVASIIVAQKIGADGASASIKYGQMARQKLQRGVTRGVGAGTAGLAARTGRNTVGRLAYAGTQNEKLKAYAARSAIGKGLYKTAQYGSKATFDARNVGGVGKQFGLGESTKGGFGKRIEDKVKAEKAFAKDLGFVETDTPEGKRKVAAKEAEIKARKEAEKIEKERAKIAAEDIKSLSNKMNTSELDEAIGGLTDSVKAMEAKISYAEEEFNNKETSVERKEELKADIDSKKGALEAERNKLDTHTKARAIAVEKSVSVDRLNAAKQAEKDARESNDYNGVQKAKADQTKHQAALAAIDGKLDEEIEKLGDELNDVNDIIANKNNALSNIATAEVKFEKQINYMDQVKRQKRLYSSVATLGLSTGGGGLLGASVVGGAAAFGGGSFAALNAVGAKNYELKQVIEALDKEYGKGGAKAVKKETSKKKREKTLEALGEDESSKPTDEPKPTEESKKDGE